jgi:hypothetical protein
VTGDLGRSAVLFGAGVETRLLRFGAVAFVRFGPTLSHVNDAEVELDGDTVASVLHVLLGAAVELGVRT